MLPIVLQEFTLETPPTPITDPMRHPMTQSMAGYVICDDEIY